MNTKLQLSLLNVDNYFNGPKLPAKTSGNNQIDYNNPETTVFITQSGKLLQRGQALEPSDGLTWPVVDSCQVAIDK